MDRRTVIASRIALRILGFSLSLVFLVQPAALGHGTAGKRFFPTTFQVEDPFVSDEFSLLGNYRNLGGSDGGADVVSTSLSAEWSKRITQDLGIMIGEEYQRLRTRGNGSVSGYGNLEIGGKYQFYTNDEHETILSAGVADEIGGTGNRKTSEPFSVVSPAFLFGKGFGDFSESKSILRPLAVTGVIGLSFPTRPQTVEINDVTGEPEVTRNPTTLNWSFSVQYSLMYLQSFVKDVGLGAPLDRTIIILEFPMETCLNRGCDRETTGTVNPGFAWIGKRMEIGIAAQLPLNDKSGKGVGVLGLFHLFLDDLLPKSMGRPIFR